MIELWREDADDYARGTYEFPERLHVNAIFFRLMWEQTTTQLRWAEWAIEQVERWPETTEPGDVEAALDVFRSVLGPAAPRAIDSGLASAASR